MNPDHTHHREVDSSGVSSDPQRDPVLAGYLAKYEATHAGRTDEKFRARLAEVTAEAMRRRNRRAWMVATSRYARIAFPMSLAAAAAAVFVLTKLETRRSGGSEEVLLGAAMGIVSAQDLASSLFSGGTADRAWLDAFGVANHD